MIIFITLLTIIGFGCLLTKPVSAQDDLKVVVIDVNGPVTPVMLGFIERSIGKADVLNAEALIIRLDTPGGQIDLTQQIIRTIIASDVPVVVYVWPPGGHAASAGTFITLSAHVAAMAPNTSIGAASPVGGSGEDIDETLKSKIENILTADIRGLAERRGKKALEWAESTIVEAKAANAEEALEIGAIDFIAVNLDELLEKLDGFTTKVNGRQVTLKTAKASVTYLEQTMVEEILSILTTPSIALLLISVGSLALAYEFINPGGYIGGVIGLICLLIGFYAVGQLPVNYAGLALILLAFILFSAELFTPTYGALTATGVASFIAGSLILFNTNEFAYELPLPSIIGIPLVIAVIFTFGLAKVIQSSHLAPVTGKEGMLGAVGTVKVALNPQGTVFVWGERWQATGVDNQPILVGEKIEVVALEGFHLTVQKREG
jgi:membrane-bound serine protease (ClpP class)